MIPLPGVEAISFWRSPSQRSGRNPDIGTSRLGQLHRRYSTATPRNRASTDACQTLEKTMKRTSLVAAILAIATASQTLAGEPATFSEKIRHDQTRVAASFARAGQPTMEVSSSEYFGLVLDSFGRVMPTTGLDTTEVSSSEYFGLVLDSFGRVMPTTGFDRNAFRAIEVSAISDR